MRKPRLKQIRKTVWDGLGGRIMHIYAETAKQSRADFEDKNTIWICRRRAARSTSAAAKLRQNHKVPVQQPQPGDSRAISAWTLSLFGDPPSSQASLKRSRDWYWWQYRSMGMVNRMGLPRSSSAKGDMTVHEQRAEAAAGSRGHH